MAQASASAMDTSESRAYPEASSRHLPTITVKRMLNMSTTSRRFKTELVIKGVRHSNLSGEPVPHKGDWQQHLSIMVLAQDREGQDINVEASSNDMAWRQRISKRLTLGATVVIEQPSFSGTK